MQDCRHQLKSIENRHIYLLTAIYFGFLLAILCCFGYTPTNDGEGYLEYAQWCLNEGQPYPTVSIYKETPFIWNIGIINLTEISLWLTGSILPLLVLLCLLKSLTALFIALTAKTLFNSHRTGLIALVLFMLYPNNWGQSTMLSSEIPSTCLAVIAVYMAIKQPSVKRCFLCGMLLAVANWFRPTAPMFIVSIAAYWLVFNRNNLLKHAGVLLVGYASFIIIVGTSCYLRTGHFIYQARSYWFSMVDECYDGAEVAPHWGQPIWPEGTPRYIENHEQMDCFEYERIWKQRSLDWLKDHKADYLSKIPGRLFYMYQSDFDYMPAFLSDKSKTEDNYITLPYRHLLSEASTLNMAQWLSLLCLFCYAFILLMASIGCIRLIRQKQYKTLFLPLFIIVGGSLMLVIIMHGETRFKDPLMPYFFILAAGMLFNHTDKREVQK